MNQKNHQWHQKIVLSLAFILSLCLINTKPDSVKAQSKNPVPSELIELITKIDLAANNQDLDTLTQYVSPQFKTTDGINAEIFTKSLSQLWEKYPNLRYQTMIESWEERSGELIATTVTEIQGSYDSEGRQLNLTSNVTAKHYFREGQLIQQEILKEKTEITSGEKPPEVMFKLPQTAKPGAEFDFDVIVTEPLGTDLLLGAVVEEEIDQELYTKPSPMKLDALSAGGIFKRVKIPAQSKDRWYSVLLIRADGLRLITQRVKIEN